MKKDKLIMTKGPANWEVIQQENGFASFSAGGYWIEDPNDDTRLPQEFDPNHICVRVVDEADGRNVTPLIPVTADGDRFQVTVKGVPVGGPYLLDVLMVNREKNTVYPVRGEKRRHFCVGDVYLIAGQSNADGMGRGMLEEAPEVGIHVLRNLTEWDLATQPFNELDYAKQSMFLRFAKKVRQKANTPIGLIPAAMGGAPLSRWLPEEDGDLFQKMKHALEHSRGRIRGVLWYQGCTDAGEGRDGDRYLKRFESFVRQIREEVSDEELPVFTFQLNRYKRKEAPGPIDRYYSVIREAQRKAPQQINDVFALPAIDALHMTDFIHSSRISNAMLGERLAMQVLKVVYDIGEGVNVPQIQEAILSKDSKSITAVFENVSDYLTALNAKVSQFPLEAEDDLGMVPLEDYEIAGNKIVMKFKRECNSGVVLHGQIGTNPDNYLMDCGTQVPAYCFYQFPVTK